MNLEAIALRRAEEQVSKRGTEILRNPNWAAAKKPVSRTARQLKCVCGHCHTCKNREAMRAARDATPKGPPKRRGRSMSWGRKCRCGRPIANINDSGLCHRHRERWRAKPDVWERDEEREITA